MIKNRLFFFAAYQGYRNKTAATQQTTVPTDAQLGRNGAAYADLSNDVNEINGTNASGLSSNPIPFAMQGPAGACAAGTPWNQCFAGGTVHVPTSDFNSISSNLLAKYVPSPNAGRFYNFNAGSGAAEDQGVLRADVQATHKDLLWASAIFQSNPDSAVLPFTGATLPGFPMNDARHFKVFNASWTHTFNPTTLNELRAGYYRFNYAAVEPASPTPPSALGFDINPQSPAAAAAPLINITGYFTLGFSNNGPQPRLDENQDYSDNFTKIAGNHNMMFGAHVERFSVNNPFYSNLNGNFGFSGSGAFTSGDPLLDFLVGVPSSFPRAPAPKSMPAPGRSTPMPRTTGR